MGLDMFLYAKKFMYSIKENDKLRADVIKLFPELKNVEGIVPKEISFQIGYWRKANHIHRWFVDNVQEGTDDCREYSVSKKQLQELKRVCKLVLKNNNNETSNELLPTQSGFFFGGTDYDEYYYQDVENTIKIIDECLKLPDGYYIEYLSSW